MQPIPFNRPLSLETGLDYMRQACAAGHLSGDGPFTHRCHALLEELLGAPRVLLTTSGTHALELAALLLDIQPGDEVIVPAFTFVSTVNAFVLRGARPVFIDIRSDTLNLDERQLDDLLTARTKAIVPVHYAGVGCEMDAINTIAARHEVAVVEDNAHGLLGKYRGQPLGSLGRLAALSFHETKNFSCGEGGALILNDPADAARAEVLREKGTNRAQFFRGQADKYTWLDVGSSFLPSDLLAALLLAQLEARAFIQERRRHVWERYAGQLQDWAEDNDVRLPTVPAHCAQPWHMFYLLLPTAADQQALLEHLRREQIMAVFHYLPLHLSRMGRSFGGRAGDCPVTEDVSQRLVRLPFYPGLSEDDQARIVEAVRCFRCGRRSFAVPPPPKARACG
ncbi:MAG: dTDP-4-amino-4,6-dideoxygalactose transaminase [Planctomycetia bacterium]|nr:dTDP-4-amino-4,6-dideoxygalactose transaminase [Planctomycetia bacterium]